MITITLPTANCDYYNLYSLTGFTIGSALYITNNGSDDLFLIEQATYLPAPTSNSRVGYPLRSGQSVIVNSNNNSVWIASDSTFHSGNIVIQQLKGITQVSPILPVTAIAFPDNMLTKGEEGYNRLRVDVAQTGFFRGREFRTFYEFSIAAGNSVTLKVNSPIDFILFSQSLTVDSGDIRFSAVVGATETGSFTTDLPIIGKNRMSTIPQPPYVCPITIKNGGTITGGTVVEVFRIHTSAATGQEATVGGVQGSERGLPAGNYYLTLQNTGTGTATGVYRFWWECRD